MLDTLLDRRHPQKLMGHRRFTAWRKVAAVAPLLLLVVLLPGQSFLRCRIDGLLRSACCCPPAAATGTSVPVVKGPDCCDREVSVNERPVVEPARRSAVDATWAISVAAPVSFVSFALAEPNRPERARQAHAPPQEGPSIVLLKQAFLI